MAFTPTSPVTGAAQTGFTSPTYTLIQESQGPGPNAKQYYVSALGGTQAGVTGHTVASPFTIAFWKPLILKILPALNAMGFLNGKVQKNVYKVVTRKGVSVMANQPVQVMLMTTTIEVPAGADLYDQANVRACISAHLGATHEQANGLAASSLTGTL